MTALRPHHRIPLIRRPFLQRNEARLERDQARVERDIAYLERDQARLERDKALMACDELRNTATLVTNLFVPPGHFFSPIVDPIEADRHIAGLEASLTPVSLNGIKMDREAMIGKWNNLLPFLDVIPFPINQTSGFRYAFENPAYSWGDGSILHAILRSHRPRRLIEVGSGWSSACAIDTIEMYCDNECDVTFVEPHPQLLRELIGKTATNVRILEVPVQQVPLNVFDSLGSGDVLFIDSTHILRTGSDVCFELFEILPRLAPGVLVHFHDIFWPFEYPRLWAVKENRSWNELYAIRAFLTNNDDWRIVFFNNYFAKFEQTLIETTYPDFLNNTGGALWLQRR